MFKIHNARAGRWQLHLKPKRVIGNTILCSFFLEYEQNKLHFENYCYFFFNIFTKVIQYRHLGHFIPLLTVEKPLKGKHTIPSHAVSVETCPTIPPEENKTIRIDEYVIPKHVA